MKIADVRAKSADQIKEEILTLRKEQLNLRLQKATGQLENTARVRDVRRTIARLKTVQNEQKAGAKPAAKAKKASAKKKGKE